MTMANDRSVSFALNQVTPHERMARARNNVMYWLCVAFTAFIILLLVLVVGYLLSIGASSMSLALFTKTPIPRGMAGYPGGLANGIVGTVILVPLAAAVGLPVGLLTGIYLAEYEASSWLATWVRFVADVLAGVPSIVVGILGRSEE